MGPSAFGLAGPDAAGADVAALAPGSFNGAPLTAGRSSSMPASLLHQPSMEPSGSEGQDVEANMVGSEEGEIGHCLLSFAVPHVTRDVLRKYRCPQHLSGPAVCKHTAVDTQAPGAAMFLLCERSQLPNLR
jgi:hypothetical protein